MRSGGFVNSPFNSRERDDFIEKEYAHGREISATAAARKSDLAKALQEMQDSTQMGIAKIRDETDRRGQDLQQPLLEAQTNAMNVMTPLKAESMTLQNEGLGMENRATSKSLAYLDSSLANNQESRELRNLTNRSAALAGLAQNRGALEDAGVDFGGLLEKFGFVRSGATSSSVASNYEESVGGSGGGEAEDNTPKPFFSQRLPRMLKTVGSYGIPIMAATAGGIMGTGAGAVTVPGVGAIPGSVVGAGLGGAMGEFGR